MTVSVELWNTCVSSAHSVVFQLVYSNTVSRFVRSLVLDLHFATHPIQYRVHSVFGCQRQILFGLISHISPPLVYIIKIYLFNVWHSR